MAKNLELDNAIRNVWAEIYPGSAFIKGLEEYAGQFFTGKIGERERILQKIASLKKSAPKNDVAMNILKCLETSLGFEEPYIVPRDATDVFYGHMVKEGIIVSHMISLASDVETALKVAETRLARKRWPTEIKILTCMHVDNLIGLIKTILHETKNDELTKTIVRLKNTAESYRRRFSVEGIEEGTFEEIFQILKKEKGNIRRKKIYPRLLRDFYDYPESPDEIERKGLMWLEEELPLFQKVANKLAKKLDAPATFEALNEALKKRRSFDKSKLLPLILGLREKMQAVFEKHIVRITPKYDTRVVETPSYLVSSLASAAQLSLNTFTDKPFNEFLLTMDPKSSPPATFADVLSALIHEEYGHAIHHSNSAARLAANPRVLDLIETPLLLPSTEGIAFHREYEFLRLLKELSNGQNLGREEQELLNMLGKIMPLEDLILEYEFIMLKWRLIRFLRAISDVRINMEKQSVVEFIEWAHHKTGISEKTIFYQLFPFQSTPGYAPSYSMCGQGLKEIQEKRLARGENLVEFNTYASSIGFPPRTIFEEKLTKFILDGEPKSE